MPPFSLTLRSRSWKWGDRKWRAYRSAGGGGDRERWRGFAKSIRIIQFGPLSRRKKERRKMKEGAGRNGAILPALLHGHTLPRLFCHSARIVVVVITFKEIFCSYGSREMMFYGSWVRRPPLLHLSLPLAKRPFCLVIASLAPGAWRLGLQTCSHCSATAIQFISWT